MDAQSNGRLTALSFALLSNNQDVALFLIGRNAALESRDIGGWQAIHWAAKKSQHDACLALLAAHANPNSANNSGMTPLWLAALAGSHSICTMLLRARASPHVESNDVSVLQIAVGTPRDDDENEKKMRSHLVRTIKHAMQREAAAAFKQQMLANRDAPNQSCCFSNNALFDKNLLGLINEYVVQPPLSLPVLRNAD
jgi:ankyrin repeat protein